MTTHIVDTHALKSSLEKIDNRWRWRRYLGALLFVSGLAAIGLLWTDYTILKAYFYSVLLFVCSAVQLIRALYNKSVKHQFWYVALAVFFVLTAITIMTDTQAASLTFAILFTGALVLLGGFRIKLALDAKRNQRSWIMEMSSGAVALVVAALLAVYWPASILWLIGVYVGVETIVAGAHQLNREPQVSGDAD